MGIAFLVLSSANINPADFQSGDEYWKAVQQSRTDDVRCPSFFSVCNFAHDIGKGFFSRKCVPARAVITRVEGEAKATLTTRLGSEFRAKLPKSDLTAFAKEISELTVKIQIPAAHELHERSAILDEPMSRLLQSFIPSSVSLEGFELMFGTHTDGWGLHQLYARCKDLSPCVLLIQVDDGAVFGAYLSTELTPAHPNPKGDGRCFIFRLNGPNAQCYPWCSANADGNVTAAHHQYFVSSNEYMSVGADHHHASNAIRLDNTLHHCVCGTSDTYNNRKPLAGDANTHQLKVVEVEILCGRAAVMKLGHAPHATPIRAARK